MKSTRFAQSILQLTLDAFKLLSLDQRRKALSSIIGSVIQASLEVVSLTAVIPIFFYLIDYSSNVVFGDLLIHVKSFSWPVILSIIFIIFLLKNLFSLWLARYQSQFTHTVFITFSKQLYERFYQQSWTDYLQSNSAETARKIKTVPSDFTTYVLQNYLTLIMDITICALMTGVLAWLDYRIVLIIMCLCVPITLLHYWFRKHIVQEVNKSFLELTPKTNIILTQGIDSFAEAKIYQKESFFIGNFMRLNEITSQYFANLKLFTAIPARLFETVGILFFVILIIYSKLYPLHQINFVAIAGLMSVAIYRIIPSVNRILINLSQIQAYSYCVSELKENILEQTKEQIKELHSLSFDKSIQFKNLSFGYTDNSSTFLFSNLNLTIAKGDFLLLEGPSGAGKTTFIHLLAGLIKNYEGHVVIDDKILSSDTLRAWQFKLGFVPQSPVVLQETILSNIAFGVKESEIDLTAVKASLKLAGLYEFVTMLPLQFQTPVGENGLTLSGGQRQRLILARALYRDPAVLLLDEVTNQLDEENKLKILYTLKELSKKGTTIILASHDPVVRTFASRILQLRDAAISEVPKALCN